MRRYILPLIIAILFVNINPAITCTSAIVSGKATPDGKPIMWKQRDTSSENNKLIYFQGTGIDYIGMVSTGNRENTSIWMGMNSSGFCIMNTASYNIDVDTSEQGGYGEGRVMAMALSVCTSLADFEHLLDTLTKPTSLSANFGVIDASGGASYYEVGHHQWIKIDVNDQKNAPLGYVIITNFSFTGNQETGQGYARYLTASSIFNRNALLNNLTVESILSDCIRNLVNGFTGDNLLDFATAPGQIRMVHFKDNIARKSSTSSAIFKGVKPGDDPLATVMWCVTGWPLATVAYPVWLNSDRYLPEILTAPFNQNSVICDASLAAKRAAMPVTRGHGQDYIDINKIWNSGNTGYLQWILPLERDILTLTNESIEGFKMGVPSMKQLSELYGRIDKMVIERYKANNIDLTTSETTK